MSLKMDDMHFKSI